MTEPAPRRASRRRRSTRWRLLVGSVLTVAAEAALFVGCLPHDPRAGWFTQAFIGWSVALIGMTVWVGEERRPVHLPGLWLVIGHLLAAFPDLLFAAGIAHRQWMDAFLGHLISHSVPGGNLAWYPLFLATLALYLAVDVRMRGRKAPGRRRRHR